MQDTNRQSTEVVIDKFASNLHDQGVRMKPTWTTIIFLVFNLLIMFITIGRSGNEPSDILALALGLMIYNSLTASALLRHTLKYKHFFKTTFCICLLTFLFAHITVAVACGTCGFHVLIIACLMAVAFAFIEAFFIMRKSNKQQVVAQRVLVDAVCINVEVSRADLINNDMSFQHSNLSPNYMEVQVPTFQYMYNNMTYTQKPLIRNNNMNFIVGQHYNIYVNPSKPDEIIIA